jgi:hypothetical protein
MGWEPIITTIMSRHELDCTQAACFPLFWHTVGRMAKMEGEDLEMGRFGGRALD